jgi:transcriptional regulator with XRE-family HTH domain
MKKVESIISLGGKLALLRRSKGWSLRQAGKRIGISAMYVSKLERDLSQPSARILKQIADIYEIDIGELVSFTETEGDRIRRKYIQTIEKLEKDFAFRSSVINSPSLEDMKIVIEHYESIISKRNRKNSNEGGGGIN